MELKPSNIFYSHDTIMYRFRKRSRNGPIRQIGETLDDLCEGRCQISDIPKIRVVKKDGKWHTLDNRRLWVFHHYEAYRQSKGEETTISVDVTDYSEDFHQKRFSTKNGGVSIRVIDGNPGGNMYMRITSVTPQVEEERSEENAPDNDKVTQNATTNSVEETAVQADVNTVTVSGKQDSSNQISATTYKNTVKAGENSAIADESAVVAKTDSAAANEIANISNGSSASPEVYTITVYNRTALTEDDNVINVTEHISNEIQDKSDIRNEEILKQKRGRESLDFDISDSEDENTAKRLKSVNE